MSINMIRAVRALANDTIVLVRDAGQSIDGRWIEGFTPYQTIRVVNQQAKMSSVFWADFNGERRSDVRAIYLTKHQTELPRAILIGNYLYKVIEDDAERNKRGYFKFVAVKAFFVDEPDAQVITEDDEGIISERYQPVAPEEGV